MNGRTAGRMVVTGAAGLIGSALVRQLNLADADDLIAVDRLGTSEKWRHLVPLRFAEYFDDLTQESRSQVWGVTFPYDDSLHGDAADAFPQEFDALTRVAGAASDALGGSLEVVGRMSQLNVGSQQEPIGPRFMPVHCLQLIRTGRTIAS